MKSCKILRYGAVCGLAALAAVGCSVDDAETIRVRELTAAEHELFVPASGGTAQIQLYSNGRVRVEALNDIGGWASVDRSEFDGDRMVSVTFTENDSFRRMAKLRFVLDGGTRADTVCIKQYGVVPSLECPAPYKAIRGSVETFTQFEIDTNIPLGDFAVATAYVGPTRDWIRSVQPEQGMPVVGAGVVVRGTQTGSVTDLDGRFTVMAAKDATLTVSFIGYTTREVPVGTQTDIRIVLEENVQSIDDVVVVGFGTQKKETVTGAIGQLSGKELMRSP